MVGTPFPQLAYRSLSFGNRYGTILVRLLTRICRLPHHTGRNRYA